MLGKLKDQGIKSLIIRFDGSGDDGEVYDLEGWDVEDDHYDIYTLIDTEDCDFIKNFTYTLLDKDVQSQYDWVNNDGGFGSVTIDVVDQTYDIDYNQRTTEEYSWHNKLFQD